MNGDGRISLPETRVSILPLGQPARGIDFRQLLLAGRHRLAHAGPDPGLEGRRGVAGELRLCGRVDGHCSRFPAGPVLPKQ